MGIQCAAMRYLPVMRTFSTASVSARYGASVRGTEALAKRPADGCLPAGSELSLVGLMQRDAFTGLDINTTNTNSLFNSPLINARVAPSDKPLRHPGAVLHLKLRAGGARAANGSDPPPLLRG